MLKAAVAKRNKQVAVYPGVELTVVVNAARIGDALSNEERKVKPYFYHVLVFLPPSDEVEKQVEVLVTNGYKNKTIMQEKPTVRKLEQPLAEIAAQVKAWGGLTLIAHFHQGKAPEKSRSHDDLFVDSLAIKDLHEHFDAVEIRTQEAAAFFTGQATGKAGDLIPEKVCVLGSDAHEPEHYAREITYVLAGENSYSDIKASLVYRERVLFEPPTVVRDLVNEVIVEGAFVPRQRFVFNEDMTALIGTKGSGKSAILECLRFGLGYTMGPGGDGYLDLILGPAGRVWVRATTATGEELLFLRGRADPEPRVTTPDGKLIQRNAVIPSHLNVEFRAWGEVTKLADDRTGQLGLIDGLDASGQIRDATDALRSSRAGLPESSALVCAAIGELRDTQAEVDDLRLQKSQLERLRVNHMVSEQEEKERRDAELVAYRELLSQLSQEAPDQTRVFSPAVGEQVRSLVEEGGQGRLSAASAHIVLGAIDAAHNAEGELRSEAVRIRANLQDAVQSQLEVLLDAARAAEDGYQAQFTKLDAAEQQVLLKRNAIVKETARLPALEARLASQEDQVRERVHAYASLLEAIQTQLTRRSGLRVQLVEKISDRLTGARVATRISLSPLQRLGGPIAAGFEPATAFAALAEQLRKQGTSDLLLDATWRKGYARFEHGIEIDDRPSLEFEKYTGVWKATNELSAGQKSTAVLPLIVLLGEGPVVLDQPEDNLDNKYIGATIVPMLLLEKRRRQFVVATHNATLTVMADTNLIVQLSDEGGTSRVLADGFLCGPHSAIRGAVLEVVDGGEKAMRRRFSRYGLTV